MAVMLRKKYGRRSEHRKPRSEKQVITARHKQNKKAAARKLGISPNHLQWVDDRLVFAANGESVRDALMNGGTTTGKVMKSGTTTGVK